MCWQDIAKQEEEAQRQRDLARFGRGQASARSTKTVAKEILHCIDVWWDWKAIVMASNTGSEVHLVHL